MQEQSPHFRRPASRLAVVAIVSAVLSAAVSPAARGEVFVLSTGGQVVGKLLNPDESPRTKFVIETTAGSRITLAVAQVKQVVKGDGAEFEYERIRPRYPDTVEGQWALAEWCREHRLKERRKTHLQRVIKLDGDHNPARRALGYSRQNDKWIIAEEVMLERGFVRFEGSWKVPQEVKLIQQRRNVAKAQGEWHKKLRRWTRALGGSKDADARRGIRSAADPYAVKALITCLGDDRSGVRILLIETMAKIGTPEAIEAMTTRSLEDPVEEVRLTCLDYLKTKKGPNLMAYYVGALRSPDNAIINRAAVALKELNEYSTVPPLIGSLVSTHTRKIGKGGQGSISPTFSTGPGGAPGGGLSVGGKPKIVSFQLRNQDVLDALVAMTGVNYGFQQQDWKDWYVSRRKAQAVNLRRE